MTFEEEFPSLKGEGTRVCDYINIVEVPDKLQQYFNEQIGEALLSDFTFTQKQVQKHCLDKAKVKEVIDKLRKGIKYARDNPINESTELAAQTQLDLIGIFEKALGL